jgi:hypothetical protein
VGERGRAREENTISHGVQHNSISNYLQYFATVGAFHTLNPKRLDTRHNGPDGEEPPGPHFIMTHATRYAALPCASAWTSAVVSGLPAIPQSPLSTSSTMHQVT